MSESFNIPYFNAEEIRNGLEISKKYLKQLDNAYIIYMRIGDVERANKQIEAISMQETIVRFWERQEKNNLDTLWGDDNSLTEFVGG